MEFFKKYFRGDRHIWAIIIGLSVVSLLAVYSSTGQLAYRFRGGDTAAYILRHARFMAYGLLAVVFIHRVPTKIYARISQMLIWLAPLLMFYTLFAGEEVNSGSRWINVLGVSIQPSDIAKLILIAYLAQNLARKQEQIRDLQHTILPAFAWIWIICGLILPANFSTAALLFLTCVTLLYVARIPMVPLIGLLCVTVVAVGLSIGAVYGLSKVTDNKYVDRIAERVPTWINRVSGDKENYQQDQATIAIGTGGPLGRGPGNSIQRDFLPHPYSDFIFAIIVEEYGIAGALVVLFLYVSLLYRTVVLVRKCEHSFQALLALGLAFSIVFQAFLNMAVAVGLGPVTGQPLPFISMGGTSLLFTGTAFGIILSVSREISEKETRSPRKTKKADSETDETAEEEEVHEPIQEINVPA